MMANFNKVILMGNLTRDPQLKYLPNNNPVCECGLAVNRRWRDRDGNQREEVCFVDLSVFGRQAETMNQYMSKGRPILIEGRLKYDTWTGQDGQKRSKLSVVVENFQFVGPREGGASGGAEGYSQGSRGYEPGAGYDQAGPTPPESAETEGPPPSGDDIPF
jgi:single-strand DNA-binding protein